MKKLLVIFFMFASLSAFSDSIDCVSEKAGEMTTKVSKQWLNTDTQEGRVQALSLAAALCSGKMPATVECMTSKALDLSKRIHPAWLNTDTTSGKKQALSIAATLCVNL